MKLVIKQIERKGNKIKDEISTIEGIPTYDWVKENHPQNGVFRVYWKEIYTPYSGSITFDPEEGNGLRYEWYYKDGKYANGVSKGWYPNGKLRQTLTWKNGKMSGLHIGWYENGQKWEEGNYKNFKREGKWTDWFENGQKSKEGLYKNGIRDGKWTFWYEFNGQKSQEGTYKDGIRDGKWTFWYPNGQVKKEIIYGERS